MHFSIFYKNFKINIVLCEFQESDTSRITEKILEKTSDTKVITRGNLRCKNKKDLNIIYKIINEEFIKILKQKEVRYNNSPNLVIESIKQLLLPYEND